MPEPVVAWVGVAASAVAAPAPVVAWAVAARALVAAWAAPWGAEAVWAAGGVVAAPAAGANVGATRGRNGR